MNKQNSKRSMDPSYIYSDLKEKIIWLDLEPGDTLNLVELAKVYDVSRNPVTIAVTRLVSEEWVEHKGTQYVVCPLTFTRIREITEIRSILETQANLWAMQRITSEEVRQLKELAAEIQKMSESASNKEMVKLDVRFHSILFRATRNSHLATLLDRMLCHYLRFWLSFPHRINKASFFDQALEMIHAIEAKDENRLKAASAEHIEVSLDEIMGVRKAN
ncbi:MAG: GntR family transcriptional regulator [Deltaproteobacteria bacterium]|nr:GntR family transcriptional regulator [Deltaproteobacteria bacterium]